MVNKRRKLTQLAVKPRSFQGAAVVGKTCVGDTCRIGTTVLGYAVALYALQNFRRTAWQREMALLT